MTSEYLRDGEVMWARAILANVERLIAQGASPNAAFMEAAGRLPYGDYTRLVLYWREQKGQG